MRGEFCFLKHFCAHCGQEIPLDPKRLFQYERRRYPKFIQGHQHFGENNVMKRPEVKAKIIGRKRPDLSARLRTLTGSKNPNFGNHTKFSESHKHNISIAITNWHKRSKEIFDELLKPEIKPETRQILLTEQEKIKIAITKLEKQRLEKLAKEREEDSKKPKEKEKSLKRFNMILCFRENKLIKCKKTKIMCRDWQFCHKK